MLVFKYSDFFLALELEQSAQKEFPFLCPLGKVELKLRSLLKLGLTIFECNHVALLGFLF